MAANESSFKMLTEIQHILKRPNMYVGSIDLETKEDYILENGKFIKKQISYVPALLKIINEVLDNSIDEAIRTDFKYSTKIKVSFDNKEGSVTIEDNGRGIEVKETQDGWIPALCWTRARAGTNFNDENRTTLGLNGLGSVATNVFSISFIGETHDGQKKCVVSCKDNCGEIDVKVSKSSKQGTKVTFIPDLKRFKLGKKEVFSENSIYQVLMYQRLLSLSVCYPGITFYFNDKQLKTNNLKSIMSLFGEEFEIIQGDNYVLGIFSNPEDEFKFFSYANGLRLANGGNHIDIVMNDIVSNIREKLLKRYKSIKPGEIKSKLFTVFYCWNFKNPKFDSQTKERLTNSTAEVRQFLGDIDLEKFSKKILANKTIIDPIVEIYKIKEEFAQRKLIDKEVAAKPKKVVSKKYTPATIRNNWIILCEGESASGSISKALGREEFGFLELRGVPISAEKASLLKFLQNEEMKLFAQVEGIDFSKAPKKRPDGESWYEIEVDGEKTIVNENDMILINGIWTCVDKLIKENH